MGGGPIPRKIALRNTWMAPKCYILTLQFLECIVGILVTSRIKWAGHMVKMKDERLPRWTEAKKQERCWKTRNTTAEMGDPDQYIQKTNSAMRSGETSVKNEWDNIKGISNKTLHCCLNVAPQQRLLMFTVEWEIISVYVICFKYRIIILIIIIISLGKPLLLYISNTLHTL